MKAVRVHQTGDLDALALEDVTLPAPGEGELRIGVRACGINFADMLMVRGLYQEKPETPFTPGLEIAGEVLEAGPGLKTFRPGDRVVALVQRGGLAEEVIAPAATTLPLPEGVDYATAAAFPVAYGTSHLALTHRANLQPGETVLVHGAAGGVGSTSVEIAKKLGATVIATASTRQKLNVARVCGADYLIDSSTEPVRDRVREITGGKGADVVIDPVGGEMFDASLRAINFEGRIVVIGFACGTIPQIPANLLLVKNISVLGLYWGAYSWKRPEILAGSMQQLLTWLAEGAIAPHIGGRYPLAEAGAALKSLADRKAVGKVVVTVGE